MTVTAMLISTVRLRPHLFIRLPMGMPRNRNHTKTMEGMKPVMVDDQSKVRCT